MVDVIPDLLERLGTATRVLLETLSVFTVLYGLVALGHQAMGHKGHRLPDRPSNLARLTFGSWLALALEFQLGADIVATTISPNESNLIQLGAIALIRTFLNIFLGREIEAEQRWEEQGARRVAMGGPLSTSTAKDRPCP
ncbi:MAG: DUF1622 domain-containing protein [Cyanobacteriota bacterium]|nr:DUF1622 domain-containing protein [Cyanobacteriota bacterium]